MKNIAILGSTGSIGCNTLEVIEQFSEDFRVSGLAAGRNIELLLKQAEKYRPDIIAVEQEQDLERFRQETNYIPEHICWGKEGAAEVARFSSNDIIVSAITGISGLAPTLAAVEAGKKVALANKEAMVTAGSLLCTTAKKNGAQIIPVDSEHSAVYQCLTKENRRYLNKVILTASGGPFFRLSAQEMANKTIAEALDHPRWKMGRKVTIDSATMMNKGLELIEAKWLFDLVPEQLDVLIHPQSIVHSLVEMCDGSILAQLSVTDMKIPIQFALTAPERFVSDLPRLKLSQIGALDFFAVEQGKFPLFALAHQALKEDSCFSIALNAANEVAVAAFLDRQIGFSDIYKLVADSLQSQNNCSINSIEEIFSFDREIRAFSRKLLKQRI